MRDLVWAITSPDLLQVERYPSLSQEDYFQRLLLNTETSLKALDRDDAPLQLFLHQNSNRRLGYYFEKLWHYWLGISPDLDLLAHNIALRSAQRTLGELDLLIYNRITQRVEHWELAVKFYLQYSVAENIDPLWFGPSLRDRLDKKLQHLLNHQLPLVSCPEAKDYLQHNGWRIESQRLITKGRLFYPGPKSPQIPADKSNLNIHHQQGQWTTLTEFLERLDFEKGCYSILEKAHWFARYPEQRLNGSELAQHLRQPQQYLPCQVVHWIKPADPRYIFIVPDHWPQQAKTQWVSAP